MGVKLMQSVCFNCKHLEMKQVDQFGYELSCKKEAPDEVISAHWGCYKYKKDKGDKHRKKVERV